MSGRTRFLSFLVLASLSAGILRNLPSFDILGSLVRDGSRTLQSRTGNGSATPLLLDLDKLSSSPYIKGLIQHLDNSTMDAMVSMADVTRGAFTGDSATCFEPLRDTIDVISDVWAANVMGPAKGAQPIWLLDVMGDSYSRWHFSTIAARIQGDRAAETVRSYGDFAATYHNHKVFCCPFSQTGKCSLRLQHFSFNTSIHQQIINQGAEFGGEPSMCVSWQWSRYSTDSHIMRHLEEHQESTTVPKGVLLSQGLHCALGRDSITLCSELSKKYLNLLMSTLHFSREIRFIVETAPIVARTGKFSDQGEIINRTIQLNEAVRSQFTSRQNSGDRANVWLADIEQWSSAIRQNPVCERDDGIHLKCDIFVDVVLGWALNYMFGSLRIHRLDSRTLELPTCKRYAR